MIDLTNITEHRPDVVLRGEFGITSGDSMIIAPNAKNGKIVVFIDAHKQVASIAHFDSAEKVEENISRIVDEMKNLGCDLKDVKCSIMEKDSEKTFFEKVQKSFKDKVEDYLKENGNDHEIAHTSWSGNDFCNVILKGTGDLMIDNSSQIMRAAMNLLIFTIEGDNRLKEALDPALITELKKVKSSASRSSKVEEVKIIKETPSTVFLKLSTAVFGKKSKNENINR